MMLDPKRTFDELIERIAADPERAEEIKANRVYRELSTAVSGSQEFTAVAKLYELQREGDFDLLVLDTPPSRNALDFLDAPGRLTSFLEGRALKAFIRPTGLGMRVLGRGAAPLLAALRRVTGRRPDLRPDDVLRAAGRHDRRLLRARGRRSSRCSRRRPRAFVLVTSAQAAAIDEAIWFRRTLQEGGLPFAGVIVNRVPPRRARRRRAATTWPPSCASTCPPAWPAGWPTTSPTTTGWPRRDRRNVERLVSELGDLGDRGLILVPQLDDDVHDVAGLERVRRYPVRLRRRARRDDLRAGGLGRDLEGVRALPGAAQSRSPSPARRPASPGGARVHRRPASSAGPDAVTPRPPARPATAARRRASPGCPITARSITSANPTGRIATSWTATFSASTSGRA